LFTVSEPSPPRLKTPVSIAPDALDFRRLIGRSETVGWAEVTAEPVFLTRLLDAQAERCSPFRVFFPLTFSDSLAAGHPNVTVTALGGAGAGRRFFARGADNVMPANISDVMGRSEGREVIGGSASQAKGSLTLNAQDLVALQSRVTAPALTIAAQELLERDTRYPASPGSSLESKGSTKQLWALRPAQMTPSCSSAAISAADNPSQSP
jgi:hypothetical protein